MARMAPSGGGEQLERHRRCLGAGRRQGLGGRTEVKEDLLRGVLLLDAGDKLHRPCVQLEESGVRRAEPHSSNDVVSGSAEMIFALDIEHRLLYGFPAEKDALADFTEEEIGAEMVVFWDERGNPLRAPPPEPSGSGNRALEPDLSPDRLPLAMQLEDVDHIDPKCPLRTTDDVRKFISAGKRERS
jgi:hypothetical protein